MPSATGQGQGDPVADMAVELFVDRPAARSSAELTAALAALEDALREETSPEQRANIFYQQGCLHEQRRDYVAAIAAYQAGLVLPAGEPWLAYFLRNNLAFCLNFTRRFAEAERWCRDAIAFDPAPPNAWKNLGVSLEHQGRPLDAADCYLRAVVQSGGQDPRVGVHLSRLVQRHPAVNDLLKARGFFLPEQHN